MKKKIKKVCTNKNNAYLCNRNQKKKFFLIQQMGRKLATFLMLKKAFEKKSLQKVLEKFGGLKKRSYLCTTFRSEKLSDEFFKRFFDLLV